jgi:hypothetical protein
MWAIRFRCRALVLSCCLLAMAGCGAFSRGPKVSNGTIDVHYVDGASKDEAIKLATYLQQAWGDSPTRRTVQVRKTPDGYAVRMVIKKEFQDDDATAKKLAFEGARISREALGSAPVTVEMCDDELTTLKAIPPRPDSRYSHVDRVVEVFYAKEADKDDAERLAKHLSKIMQNNTLVSFKLTRRGEVAEVHMVTNPEALKNPEILAALRNDRKAISDNVFAGQPVELLLCNDLFDVVRTIKD